MRSDLFRAVRFYAYLLTAVLILMLANLNIFIFSYELQFLSPLQGSLVRVLIVAFIVLEVCFLKAIVMIFDEDLL